jgi:hypothetical protein
MFIDEKRSIFSGVSFPLITGISISLYLISKDCN